MSPVASRSASWRLSSPCRAPFGKSKKRTRSSSAKGSSAARVSSSTPSPTTKTSTEASSWSSALRTAIRKQRGVPEGRDQDRRVDHVARARARSSRDRGDDGRAFGRARARRAALRADARRRRAARRAGAAPRASRLRSSTTPSGAVSIDGDVLVPAAAEHGDAVGAVELDRALAARPPCPRPRASATSRRRGGRRSGGRRSVALPLGDRRLRVDRAHRRSRSPIERSCGASTQTGSTSSCALPHPTRTVFTPETAPSRPSCGDRGDLQHAGVVAPLVHHEQAVGRAGGQALGRAGSSVSGFSQKTGTSRPSSLVENGRMRARRRRDDNAVEAEAAIRCRRRSPPRRPPSARALLSGERATTGTSHPSETRSRRMWRPQFPQPTSPTTMRARRAAPAGVGRRAPRARATGSG